MEELAEAVDSKCASFPIRVQAPLYLEKKSLLRRESLKENI
jgi:hypothetical protein